MYVYVIVNSETLKIYIGQHKGKNLRQYLQQKQHEARSYLKRRSRLYASMRKHPKEIWSIHPLIADLQTREECDYWERLLIKTLNTQHSDVGYNICRGGEGFTGPHTEAWKQEQSQRSKNWHASLSEEERQEQNRKIGAAQPPKTPEQLAMLADAREHAKTPEMRARFREYAKTGVIGMKGRRHSDETLAKMRESAKARGISPETQQKMLASRAASGSLHQSHPNYNTPEGVEKIRKARLGKPWSAARRAAYNKTISSISEV
jgi:GIY-YIG catalytic domain